MKYSPTITDSNTCILDHKFKADNSSSNILDHEFNADNYSSNFFENSFKKKTSSLETLEIVKTELTSPISSPGTSDIAEDDSQLKARITHGFNLHLLNTAPQWSNRCDMRHHHYRTQHNPSDIAEQKSKQAFSSQLNRGISHFTGRDVKKHSANTISSRSEKIGFSADNTISSRSEKIGFSADSTFSSHSKTIGFPADNTISGHSKTIGFPADDNISGRSETIGFPAGDTISGRSETIGFPADDTIFGRSETIRFTADNLQGLDMTINSVPNLRDGNVKQCINRNLINIKTSAPVQELNDEVKKDENCFMSQQKIHVKLKQELDKFEHSSVVESINILSEEESSVNDDYNVDGDVDDGITPRNEVSDTELDDLAIFRSNRTFRVNCNIQNKMDLKSPEKTQNKSPVFNHSKYYMEIDSNEPTPKGTSGVHDTHSMLINGQPMTLTLDEPSQKWGEKSQKHSLDDVYEFPSDETSKSSIEDFSYETFDKNVLHKRQASEPFLHTCKVLPHCVSVPGSRVLSDTVSVPGSRVLSDTVSVPGSGDLSDCVSVPGITRRIKLVHNVYRDKPPRVKEKQGPHKCPVGANIFKQDICDTTQANEQTFLHNIAIDDGVDDDVDHVDDHVDVADDLMFKNTCQHDKCFTESTEVDKSDVDIVNCRAMKDVEHGLRVHTTSDNAGPMDFSIGIQNEPLSKKSDDGFVRKTHKDKNNKHIRHTLKHKGANTCGFIKDISVVSVDNSDNKTGLLDDKCNVANECTVISRTNAISDTDMLSDGKCSHKSQSVGTFISGTRCYSNVITMNLEEDESGAEKDRLKVMSGQSGAEKDRLKVMSGQSGAEKDRLKVMSGQSGSEKDRLKVMSGQSGSQKDRLKVMSGQSGAENDILKVMSGQSGAEKDRLKVRSGQSGSQKDRLKVMSGQFGSQKDKLKVMLGQSGAQRDRLKVMSGQSGTQKDRLKVMSGQSGTQKDILKVISGQSCDHMTQLTGIGVNETSVTRAHVGGSKGNRSSHYMDEICVEPPDICEITHSRRVSDDDKKIFDTEHVDESGSINDFSDFISGMCHPDSNIKGNPTVSVLQDTEEGLDSANLLIPNCDKHFKPNIIRHGASNNNDTEPHEIVRHSDLKSNMLKRISSNEINLCPSKSVKRGCHTDDHISDNLKINVDSAEQHLNINTDEASILESPETKTTSKEPADSLKEYLESVKHGFLSNFTNDRNTPFIRQGHLAVPMATVEYGSEMSENPIGSSRSSSASVSESSSVFDSSNKLNDDVDESSQNEPKFEDDEGEHGHQGNWNETLKSFILQNLEGEHVARPDAHQVVICEPERRPSLEAMLEEKLAEQYLHRNLDLLRNKTSPVVGLSHRKRDLYGIFKDSENEESFFRQVVGMEAIKDLRTEHVKDLSSEITGTLPGHCARSEKEQVHVYKDDSILMEAMKVYGTEHFDFVGSDFNRTDNVYVYGNSKAPVTDSIINAEAVNTVKDGMSTHAQLPSNSYAKFTAASSHNEPRGDVKRSMNVSQIVFPSTSNSRINSSILPVQGLSHLYDLGEHGNHGILQTHVQPRPAHTGSNSKGQYSAYSDLFEKGHHSNVYLKSKGDNNETLSEYEDSDFLLNLVKGESDI